MISKDRRSSRRFPLKLPLTIRWLDDGVASNAITESLNISICGLYFYLPKELKNALPLEIVMTLSNGMTVRTHGRIVRSSPEHFGNVGVAASVEGYEFCRMTNSKFAGESFSDCESVGSDRRIAILTVVFEVSSIDWVLSHNDDNVLV